MTSDSSSGEARPNTGAPRRQFRLTGPSRPLDPKTNAVRRDLADIAFADAVFAQHYAVAIPRRLNTAALLYAQPRSDVPPLAELPIGATFNLLDIGDLWAWGSVDGNVGYVLAAALASA